MPTGFDVHSGSTLSEKLIPVAERLADFLMRSREAGAITPERPKTAAQLVEIGADAGIKLECPTIRAMVNYLRIHRRPIASTGSGYFWAKSPAELGPTIIHMMERISAIQNAVSGLERAFTHDGQSELF